MHVVFLSHVESVISVGIPSDTTFWRQGRDRKVMLGKVEEFDSTKEEWLQYVVWLSHFFDVNVIDCRKQTRCVASSNRPATYKVLRSPKKLGEESYANLVKILADHISPIPSEIVQRFKFNSRSRKPGDSVATYVAEFCAIAEFCNARGYVEGQDCVWYQRQCYTKAPAS